ncbi:MAG TPA: hypothetical protein VKV39_14845 [Candidatus Sulfotelmatobacter sp.]|nr:hypothetical protein [Candidatus Sulfotelmatobacter sp.]
MKFLSLTTIFVILAGTTALAQSAQPGTTKAAPILNLQSQPGQNLAGRRGPASKRAVDPLGLTAMREQVSDMATTVSQMHALLQQMHAKAAASKATSSLSKVNLDLWDSVVGQLDKELQHLRVDLAVREDMEVRRADLYRQADANAAAQLQAFRAAQAARFAAQARQNGAEAAAPNAAGQESEQSPAQQSAPPQPSPNPSSPQ